MRICFIFGSKTLALNKNNEKKDISDFSFTSSREYFIFNVGPENIKYDKENVG